MGLITSLNFQANWNITTLTSFDGGNMTGLTHLYIENNQLTSFNGSGLSSLYELNISENQLTSFNGSGLTSLTDLNLSNNPLTTFNGGDMGLITELYFMDNWNISTLTSFDGGNMTGLTELNLNENQLTSFNGSGLSSLMGLYLSYNQLTSLDGLIFPSSIAALNLSSNQLTSFDGTIFPNLNHLNLQNNLLLTSFDGTGLSSLTYLNLYGNPLTTFIGGDMGLITILDFFNWNITTLTSFDGTGLSSLTQLWLGGNQLTSFDGTGLSSLTALGLGNNQLTSFNGTGLSSLTDLSLEGNLLTSLDVSPLVNLYFLRLYLMGVKGNPTLTNPITPSSNNQILFDLAQHSINGGRFFSTNGRTSASNSDYDNLLNNLAWSFSGLDLIVVGNGKMRIKGLTSGGGTTTTTTTEAPTTTTTTTTAIPQGLISNVVINTRLGKNGETFYEYNVTLNQDKYDTSAIISTNIGETIAADDIYFYGVDSNGNFIIDNNGDSVNGQNYTVDNLGGMLPIRKDLFTGNLRVAIGYYVNEQNYGVYEIYPTVYTVS